MGKASVLALARHNPAHIYFSGRNTESAKSLVANVQKSNPLVGITFVKMDMASLAFVKRACTTDFTHNRLDLI
jgi:hypothetical protein